MTETEVLNLIEKSYKIFIDKKYSNIVFGDAKDPFIKSDKSALFHIITELKDGYMEEVHTEKIKKQICEREGITSIELNDTLIWHHQLWKEYGFKENKAAYAKAKKFLEEIPDESYIYIFEYSDNNGDLYSDMEHGEIFHKLPHIKVSKH